MTYLQKLPNFGKINFGPLKYIRSDYLFEWPQRVYRDVFALLFLMEIEREGLKLSSDEFVRLHSNFDILNLNVELGRIRFL
jgi:hypothetical protein